VVIVLVAKAHLWINTEAVSAVEKALANVAGLVAVAVLDPGGRATRVAIGKGPRQPDLVTGVLRVKVLGPHRLAKHHVVVEVKKPVREARDFVKIGLDRWAAERGELVGAIKDLLVRDNGHLGVVEV
jgi:hypothetical protein